MRPQVCLGGNFISIDTIHQTLVLLNDDVVGPGNAGGPSAASFDTETALAVDGRAEADGIPGILGTPVQGEEDAGTVPSAEPAPDNLLVNKALLKTVGVGTAAYVTESLAGILASPTDDLDALQEKLLNNPALAGLEQARALKINGDLILSNTINQTILASARDDILVEAQAPAGLARIPRTVGRDRRPETGSPLPDLDSTAIAAPALGVSPSSRSPVAHAGAPDACKPPTARTLRAALRYVRQQAALHARFPADVRRQSAEGRAAF
jgi:hypothetical protein